MTTESSAWAERRRELTGFWRWLVIVLTVAGIAIAVDYVFIWQVFGVASVEQTHYFLLMALFLAPAFLHFPIKPGIKGVWARRLFWFDIFLFLLCIGITLYFSSRGFDIIIRGWAAIAPPYAIAMAVMLWALLLEALRRSVGWILAAVILFFSVYPIFAEYMPGLLEGIGFTFIETATFHIFSIDSAVGMLMKVFSDLVIGFIVFGVVIVATGGGQFFLNLALSIVGRTRGGPAKVAVIASALFGSMSGSVIANVVTTGSVTIPAMKKTGYPPHYAGAIECCSSTGGALAPPIMGAVAFVLASFIERSYAYVALAAAIPAFLYFLGLLIQVDAFAAKKRLHGLSRSETPSFFKTLKEGWFYLPAAIVLLYFLFVERRVGESPWIAALTLLILAQIGKNSRFTLKSLLQFIQDLGRSLTELVAVMSTLGMLLGSFAITGVAQVFASEVLHLAGGNLIFMLILGAVAALIMGMGMPSIAAYIFLAIVVAPALVMSGINILAAHLFIMYCGILAYITPPVAVAAFPAGIIAEAPPMKVAATAVRLGGVIFLLPFFFVLDPSLILEGGVGDIVLAFSTTTLGVFLIGAAFEGYFAGLGQLWSGKSYGYLLRAGLIISGILLGLNLTQFDIPWWQTKLLGLVITGVILVPAFLMALRRRSGGTGSLEGTSEENRAISAP